MSSEPTSPLHLEENNIPIVPVVVDAGVIESHKENIVPTRDGRSAAAISQLYSVPRAQRVKWLAEQHAIHREACNNPSDPTDPLEPYCAYVKWVTENYPSGTSAESGLFNLLEEVTRKFHDDESDYKSDRRYVKLWLQYANLTEQSERVYAYMLANDIGVMTSPYEEYAIALERNGKLSQADQIYRLGIERRVKNVAHLRKKYDEFQTRCLATPVDRPPEPERPPPTLGGRVALGTRSVAGPASTSARGGLASSSTSRMNRGKIAVFTDAPEGPSNPELQTNEWGELETRSASTKENTHTAASTEGVALHQSTASHPPRTPKIPIFRDSTATSAATSELPEHVFHPTRAPVSDAFSRDPFAKWGNLSSSNFELPPLPSSVIVNAPPPTIPPPPPTFSQPIPQSSSAPTSSGADPSSKKRSTSSRKESRDPWNAVPGSSAVGPKAKPVLAPPAPGKRKEVLMVDIDQIWRDGEEYDRKESRARHLGLLSKTWKKPEYGEDDPEIAEEKMKKARGERERLGLRDEQIPLKGDSTSSMGTRRKSQAGRRSVAAPSSPTTNTKAALNDVFDMFNHTQKFDDLEEEEEEEEDIPPVPTTMSRLPTVPTFVVPPTPTPLSSGPTPSRAPLSWTPFQEPNQSSSSLEDRAGPSSLARPTPKAKFAVFAEDATPAPSHNLLAPTPRVPLGESSSKSKTGRIPVFSDATPQVSSTSTIHEEDEAGWAGSQRPVAPLRFNSSSPHSSVPALSLGRAAPPSNDDAGPEHLFSPETPAPSIIDTDDTFPRLSLTRQLLNASQSSEDYEPEPALVVKTPGRVVDDEEEIPSDLEDSIMEDEIGNEIGIVSDEDPGPLIFDRKRAVDIMTPIAERTVEFSTATTKKFRADRGGSATPLDNATSPAAPPSPSPMRLPRVSHLESPVRLRARASIAPGVTLPPPEEEEPALEPEAPLNPFDAEVIQMMIDAEWQALGDLLDEDDIPRTALYKDYQDQDSGALEALESWWRKQRRLLKAGNPPLPELPLTVRDIHYRIVRKIGEGGFGAVYLAVDDSLEKMMKSQTGDDEDPLPPGSELVAIKVVRPSMMWEFVVLHIIRHEIQMTPYLESIVRPREFYHHGNESLLALEYSPEGTLLQAVNRAKEIGVNTTDTQGIDELLVMFFAIELLRVIIELHRKQFIHGDLKIDNCLLRLSPPSSSPPEPWSSQYDPTGAHGWHNYGIKLIDFGRSIDCSIFAPGQEFFGDWETDKRDCIEMRQGRPWTFQTDYWGLAGIIYTMLFGKFLETTVGPGGSLVGGARETYKIATPFKRYWQTGIWERLFRLLLNSPSIPGTTAERPRGQLPLTPELCGILGEMEDWLVENCEKKGKSLKRMLVAMQRLKAPR